MVSLELDGMIRARSLVLESTKWLTAEDYSNLSGRDKESAGGLLRKWELERLIFSIDVAEVSLYPMYAFDISQSYFPASGLPAILNAFGSSKDGWGLAFWFVSVNGFLRGERPQDLVEINPLWVLGAALDHLIGVQHG